MVGGIPSEAVGVSVAVLIYSIINLTLCTLLVCLLITFGERWTYVTILSSFTALSTFASIIQQIHYATNWEAIKQDQFERVVRALTEKGLVFGGAAGKVDFVLFFIQFWCYNTMALNLLFWTVALFTASWGYRTPWLGNWLPKIGPISKIFSFVFPSIIIGLMNAKFVTNSGPATFIISNITMILSLAMGSVLLILILYKYMKTRRLATGGSRRGRWWASDGSKSQQSRDVGSHYTLDTGVVSNSRRSIYDRALITRFSIGFVVLAIFIAAIIVFSYISSTTNASIAAAGAPDHSISGTIIDVVLFIPGVTASLVTFLVFGTAKSWRQYRDLVVGGCGIRKRILEKRSQIVDEGNRDQGLEFERLPSLQNTQSADERARAEEAKDRVKMFAKEVRISSTGTSFSRNLDDQTTSAPSHSRNNSSASHIHFHPPRPSVQTTQKGSVSTSAIIELGFTAEPEDQVIQSGHEQIAWNQTPPLAVVPLRSGIDTSSDDKLKIKHSKQGNMG